ncbi:thiol-disulfide isomerase/thioredoxin [Lewinella aquimaris]|uniref:Thiol-disulfide isomerase/thioredoxin n=1 Tax=Neolewinella aquimaris TaxID=1835722 RepID=A0A840E7I9_9BACT|nr:TlpA disulfide reductase family protein [Neolewinella aquimaris]MBB4078028.1 thiol-disulfide isomerase/thioredoxin [Neolewinella aquimaris]
MAIRVYSSVITLLILLTAPLGAQREELFRGMVRSKSYDHDPEVSSFQKSQASSYGIPPAELDTFYVESFVCVDTVVVYFKSVSGLTLLKQIQFGGSTFIHDKLLSTYLKMPVREKGLSGLSRTDWKRNKNYTAPDGFRYDLKAVHSKRPTYTHYLTLDKSVQHSEQLALDGQFVLMFHPEGRILRRGSVSGSGDEITTESTFIHIPELDCSGHTNDLITVRDLPLEELTDQDRIPTDVVVSEHSRDSFRMANTYNAAGESVDFLDSLKGRYIYIDFWASWCQPCLSEMPFLKEIGETYAEKNLAVYSVSLDNLSGVPQWKNRMEQFGMDWHNSIMYDGMRSAFAKMHGITAIPHYMLIDDRGRIVNGFVARPSDPRLRVMLDGLLDR